MCIVFSHRFIRFSPNKCTLHLNNRLFCYIYLQAKSTISPRGSFISSAYPTIDIYLQTVSQFVDVHFPRKCDFLFVPELFETIFNSIHRFHSFIIFTRIKYKKKIIFLKLIFHYSYYSSWIFNKINILIFIINKRYFFFSSATLMQTYDIHMVESHFYNVIIPSPRENKLSTKG